MRTSIRNACSLGRTAANDESDSYIRAALSALIQIKPRRFRASWGSTTLKCDCSADIEAMRR